MHLWLIDIHPLSYPIANEINYCLVNAYKYANFMYIETLLPVIKDVNLVISHIN